MTMSLNKPTALHDASKQQLDESNVFKASNFALGVVLNEDQPRVRFLPDFVAVTELSRLIYSEWIIDTPELNKLLIPEDLDYYITALVWLRILGLKIKNQDPTTPVERELRDLIYEQSYNVPEPIRLFLLSYGNITTALGTHLYPEFPPLPAASVPWDQHPALNVPGFYANAPADFLTHNLYEEVPALGVAISALITAQQPGVGRWIPPITPQGTVPTRALLNYRPTMTYRNEAIAHIITAGISNGEVVCNPPNTGFNMQLLQYISDQMSKMKTFKITSLNVLTMSEFGSQAQIAETHPLPDQNQLCIDGELQVKTMACENSTTIGVALAFVPRLFKESPLQNDTNWSCFVSEQAPFVSPDDWRDNRNARRLIRNVYHQTQWTSVSKNGLNYRRNVIETFVLTPR